MNDCYSIQQCTFKPLTLLHKISIHLYQFVFFMTNTNAMSLYTLRCWMLQMCLQIRKVRRRLQATAASEQPMTVPSVRATTKKVSEPLKGKRPEAPLTLNTPEVPLMKNPLIMTNGESTALFSCCQSICSATDPAVVAAKEQSVENPTIYCVAG